MNEDTIYHHLGFSLLFLSRGKLSDGGNKNADLHPSNYDVAGESFG